MTDVLFARLNDTVARAAGAKDISATDFLLHPPTEEEREDQEKQALISRMRAALAARSVDEEPPPESTPQGKV